MSRPKKKQKDKTLENDNLKTDIGLKIYQEMIRELIRKNKNLKRDAQIMEEIVIMGHNPHQVGRKYKVHYATISRIRRQYKKIMRKVIKHYAIDDSDKAIKRL